MFSQNINPRVLPDNFIHQDNDNNVILSAHSMMTQANNNNNIAFNFLTDLPSEIPQKSTSTTTDVNNLNQLEHLLALAVEQVDDVTINELRRSSPSCGASDASETSVCHLQTSSVQWDSSFASSTSSGTHNDMSISTNSSSSPNSGTFPNNSSLNSSCSSGFSPITPAEISVKQSPKLISSASCRHINMDQTLPLTLTPYPETLTSPQHITSPIVNFAPFALSHAGSVPSSSENTPSCSNISSSVIKESISTDSPAIKESISDSSIPSESFSQESSSNELNSRESSSGHSSGTQPPVSTDKVTTAEPLTGGAQYQMDQWGAEISSEQKQEGLVHVVCAGCVDRSRTTATFSNHRCRHSR